MNYYLEDLEAIRIVQAVYNDIKIESERKKIKLQLDIED
jgi:hypothetical protein